MAEGRLAEARIAVGSVGPLAVRAPEAEALLIGGSPIEDVADAAAEASGAVGDDGDPDDYKLQLVRVLVRRTIPDALRRAGAP